MPAYEEDIKEATAERVLQEADMVRKLLEYTKEKMNPWRADFQKVIKECYDFKELRQWEGLEALLDVYSVPPIAIDRIDRAFATLDGIRYNNRSTKKITPREMGDSRIAEMLDGTCEYVRYSTDFDLVKDDAWDDLKTVGIGIRKLGFDSSKRNLWFEHVNPEDCQWSYTRKKNWENVRWIVHRMTMDWEDAIRIAPAKASQIKALKSTMVKKWEEIKGTSSASGDKDYGAEASRTETAYEYPDQVNILEFWIRRIIPYKTISRPTPTVVAIGPDGVPVESMVETVQKVESEYIPQEGEQFLGDGVDEIWFQHLLAGGKNEEGSILLTPVEGLPSEFPFHPFVPEVADYTKSGRPVGLAEKIIPHQKRINLAWAQKIAFNNKSIKSPLIIKGEIDIPNAIQQSSIGAIFKIPQNSDIVGINTVPNVNLQSIEEGNVARQDMDFAAAATEPVMRGEVEAGTSGIRMAQQQSAATTPLNKWVKAENDSELIAWRKILHIVIAKFPPEQIMRIIGEQKFMQLVIGKIDPMSGKPVEPPIQLPISVDTANYDVVIQDQAISDLQKQQAFNSSMAMHQSGFVLDAEYMFKNAPIKNPEEAYQSHLKAKAEMMQMMMLQAQMQMEQAKAEGQEKNKVTGKSAPQAGKRSMIGGQNG